MSIKSNPHLAIHFLDLVNEKYSNPSQVKELSQKERRMIMVAADIANKSKFEENIYFLNAKDKQPALFEEDEIKTKNSIFRKFNNQTVLRKKKSNLFVRIFKKIGNILGLRISSASVIDRIKKFELSKQDDVS